MEKIKLALALAGLAACLALLNPFAARGQQSKPSPTPATATPTATPPNYERFTHQTHLGVVKVPGTFQAHELKCDSCHDQRDLMKELVPTSPRNKQLRLKFPGHKACVECHVTEFTALPQKTCSICHVVKPGPNNGLTARPPQRDFPLRTSFNAFFDAKQHATHAGYDLPNGNKTSCNFCHQQVGTKAALSVASHPECYVCHSPNSANQKASQKTGCFVCHTEQRWDDIAVYGRRGRAFGAKFAHDIHVRHVNGDCSKCHAPGGGSYNQTSPSVLKITAHASAEQRGKGCYSCHNGNTAFSSEPGVGTGGGSCAKCHDDPSGKITLKSGL